MWRPYVVWSKRRHRVLRLGICRPRSDRIPWEYRYLELRIFV